MLSFVIFSGCSLLDTSSRYQAQDERSIGSHPSKYTKAFNVDYETVWSAVLDSLDGMPLDKIDKDKGLIKTGWVEGLSQRKARSILTDRFLEDYRKERFQMKRANGRAWDELRPTQITPGFQSFAEGSAHCIVSVIPIIE